MRYGAEENEDVPDGVVVGTVVVSKEIGSCGVKQPLCQNAGNGVDGKTLVYAIGYEQAAPSHKQIKSEGEAWILAYGNEFVHHTGYDKGPLQAKDQPSLPSSHHTNGYGGVRAGYHHIDADVVALAEGILHLAWLQHVVDGA